MRSKRVIEILQAELEAKDEHIQRLMDDNRRLMASALTASTERAASVLVPKDPSAKKEPRPAIVPIGA